MNGKMYHRIGESGFWIYERYAGRMVAFNEWPFPDSEPEVIADADMFAELKEKLGSEYWVRSERSTLARPVCRIQQRPPK